ncbi:MAG: hypothetical protein AAGA92_03920 [Planctomycetota bacterium]
MGSGSKEFGLRFRVDPGANAHDGPSAPAQDLFLEAAATKRVAQHDYFRSRMSELSIRCRGGKLEVLGRLPSFYLKQVLQTCLRELPGIEGIENRVLVVSASGLSSPPVTSAPEVEG